MQERIYCAAIWYKELKTDVSVISRNPINIEKGIVVLGHRHADIIRNVYNLMSKQTKLKGALASGESIQGFLTNTNRFVDRLEGAGIAVNANQILNMDRFNPSQLFSEDIY